MENKEQWIRETAAQSTSWKDFAERLGYSYQTARAWSMRYKLDIPDGRVGNPSGSPKQAERNHDIWHRRYNLNETLQSIGERYGITRQRVLAIAKREAKRLAKEV